MAKTKEYTIYSDLHIGSPYEINVFKSNENKLEKLKFSKNTVFLGDNFDIEDCLKNELELIRNLRKKIKEKVSKAKGIFIDGNHELSQLDKNNFYVIRKDILFIHGDIIDYSFEGAKKWRARKKPGRTKLFWGLLKMYREIFSGEIKKMKEKNIERAIKIANNFKCHTIIFGHFHIKNLTIIKKDGIKIVIFPKGISKIIV